MTARRLFLARVYDEKFHLLQSPQLFRPDLEYYRFGCEMRNVPLSVAFVDIDDFKSYNSQSGNHSVDRYLLPPFMRSIESHLYYRGHAYRYGGDEYMILLPNSSQNHAVAVLQLLQATLAGLKYEEIKSSPTISIGLYTVRPDCCLTEREIEAKASEAKDFAKKHGKSCVAAYPESDSSEENLSIVSMRNDASAVIKLPTLDVEAVHSDSSGPCFFDFGALTRAFANSSRSRLADSSNTAVA